MDTETKLELIKKNTIEIITEEELLKLLKEKKNPVAYCGYEPSGPVHLGHMVTILKLIDLENAGFKVKVLLADLHALLNKKSSESEIKKECKKWEKVIRAIGLDAEFVVGSDFQFSRQYWAGVMNMAIKTTINRGERSMVEIARGKDVATISQLLYPLMQAEDIKALGIDVAVGGMEQRKVHMIAKELLPELGHKFVALHTPLITSLKGPGEKMSKSVPGSGISVEDSDSEIRKTISGAYCPVKVIEDNPILQIARLIIFSRIKKLKIQRDKKFGGDLEIQNYAELEKLYREGKIHPLDIKKAVAEELVKIIKPVRDKLH